MYEELREFARRQDFLDFIDQSVTERLPNGIVRGVHIGVDEFWVESWLAEWAQHKGPCQWLGTRVDTRWMRTFTTSLYYDFSYKPPFWDEHCKARGYPVGGNPIYIKFILLQEFERKKEINFQQSWEGYPIIYEYRPRCRGLSMISSSLGKGQLTIGASIGLANPNPTGSIGGFLRDSNTGKAYLVSCAHVMRQNGADVYHPSPSEWGRPKKIGQVRFCRRPPPIFPGINCNRFAFPNAESLDLAVAELDDGISLNPEVPQLGPVGRQNMIRNMNPRDLVVFVGRTSGLIEAQLGGLNIWDIIDIDNQPRCFGDLFVMKHRRRPYLNTNLAEDGDSGAWVLNITNDVVGWDGMVIAGDGTQAYGCFAETIKEVCDSQITNTLVLHS